MKETRDIMGMHVTVEIKDSGFEMIEKVFQYLKYIDDTFSTYKTGSEISRINHNELEKGRYSSDMNKIFKLAEETKQATHGYFDILKSDGTLDPSGIVKGWAVWQAGLLLEKQGSKDFFIDAGGDIQTHISQGRQPWTVGIRNPFNVKEIVKILYVHNKGVATSGTYERGQHIYNPYNPNQPIADIVSLTVIGPNIYEADRFATAAFAMGKGGINFIERLDGFEGYMIDNDGIATMTSNFNDFTEGHA